MATEREAYLCLSAMLRAREPKLLNTEKSIRMLEAPSFEDAAKVLTDCGYADMSQMSAREIEASLNERRNAIFAELDNMSPQKELVDVFRMKYDYHNAKAIIKAEAMDTDATHLLSGSGRIDGEKLLSLYNGEQYNDMPGMLKTAVIDAKNELARTNNPQLADLILDKAYFAEIRHAAENVGSGFFNGYADILIDCANLKSAVRVLRMGKSAEFLESVLIDGGTVSADRLEKVSDKEGLVNLFAHTKLEKAAVLGGEAFDGGSMTAFELECDNALNRYLASARRVSYGPEAVVEYLAAVESEITAVRMILTGRLAGIAPQVIRERLRDLYA